jgi:hypothetical protein
MSLVATTSPDVGPVLTVTIIVSVMAVCALFGWMAWRTYESVDRAERDPRYRLRLLLGSALFYVMCASAMILLASLLTKLVATTSMQSKGRYPHVSYRNHLCAALVNDVPVFLPNAVRASWYSGHRVEFLTC